MKVLKWIILILLVLGLTILIGEFIFISSTKPNTVNSSQKIFEIKRLLNEPIIANNLHPSLAEETRANGYKNINGPTLIKVPSIRGGSLVEESKR